MSTDQVGTIVLYVNGTEFDCTGAQVKRNAGRKPVSSMNSDGEVRLQAAVTKSTALTLDVLIPEHGDINWESVNNATVTIESLDGTYRTTYPNCGVTDYSDAYQDGGEAKRTVTVYSLGKPIRETVTL